MCGIVGYIGKQKQGLDIVISGLEALEYRGYDSAGVAYLQLGSLVVDKQVGRVSSLRQLLGQSLPVTQIAIGHTRWATHGSPTQVNAHPHFNKDRSIMVVHNGIIENYAELKARLTKEGYRFASETDTEVVAHLLDYYSKESSTFADAFAMTLRQLRGAYGLLVLTTKDPEVLYAARLGSPLVLGVAKDGYIIGSDPSVLIQYTKRVVYLNDYEFARIPMKGTFTLRDLKNDKTPIARDPETLNYDANEISLGDYPHFMLKEIYEAPQTVRAASLGRVNVDQNIVRLDGLDQVEMQMKGISRIVIVACGTSYYAGLVGEYLIEEIAGIPVEVQYASEFKYRSEPISRSTALLAISQSGETADTIAALQKVEDHGVLRFGIVNAVGSTIARMTDAGVYCHAGPEQAVASTKAFMAQVTVLLEIALRLGNGTSPLHKPLIHEIMELPKKIQSILAQADEIKKIAEKYASYRDFLYIGRGYNFPVALEGALKLKEVSYIHAEGYAAGEMKHGPLAMITPEFPTFAVATDGELLEKTYSNIEEIKARKGPVLAVGTKGNTSLSKIADDVIYVPPTLEQTSPLLVSVVMQLFSYYIAVAKGLDVDKPRNLAKSVTVE